MFVDVRGVGAFLPRLKVCTDTAKFYFVHNFKKSFSTTVLEFVDAPVSNTGLSVSSKSAIEVSHENDAVSFSNS